MIVRSVVVLPAPFRPTKHTTSRSRTSRETRRRMWLACMNTSTSWTDSMSDTPPHPHVPLTLPSPPPGARVARCPVSPLARGESSPSPCPLPLRGRGLRGVPSLLWRRGESSPSPCPLPLRGRGERSPSPLRGEGRVRGGDRGPAPPPHHHVHHLRVRLDLCWRGVGQHLALVQRDDAVRVAEDDVHVVLDLDDGAEPHALRGAHEDLHHRMLVRRGHPARGLVEQDDLRLEGERRGHVEELLVALRQLARGRVGFFVEIEERGDLKRFPLNAAIARQRSEEA